MEPKRIYWKSVPNNVTKRMVNLSLVHKLVPSRKLNRRTKVMNTAIRHFHVLRTYSQYVKMKTSVLRNMSDDSDTDDYTDFKNDDYNVLYKSGMPIPNYLSRMPISNADEFSEEKIDIIKRDTEVVIENINSQECTNTFADIVNPELQENVQNVDMPYFSRENIQRIRSSKLNNINNYKDSTSSMDSFVSEKDVVLTTQEACSINECVKPNEIICEAKEVQETEEKEESNVKLIEEESKMSIDLNLELEEKNCCETLSNKEELIDIKENSKPQLNQDVIQDVEEPLIDSNVNLQHNDSAQSIEDVKVDEESVDEDENNKFLPMPSLLNDNKHQPKDSGIDEDTEEEFPEKREEVRVREEVEREEDCESMKLTSSSLDCNNFSEIETNLTADTIVSNTHDTSDINLQPEMEVTMENINNEKNQQDKSQKQKLTPIVTCTEIFNQRYRIVSREGLVDSSIGSKGIDNSVNSEKALEPVEIEHNIEDSMSPLSKRRLQQLRRLNLTVDSESSLSDDDNQYCNTENMRDKLFKRWKESSESLDSEDDSMIFKHSSIISSTRISRMNESYRFQSNKKEKNNYLRESYTASTEDEETFNNNESTHSVIKKVNNSELASNTLNCSVRNKTGSLKSQRRKRSRNSLKQNTYSTDNESNSSEENTVLEGSFQESQTIDTTLKSTVKSLEIQRRPSNLQELVEKGNLIQEFALPSVTLKDLQENDIYLLDVPSVVFEKKLLGREFTLTKNKLKLGKQKYKITLNDAGHVSCVFNTGESCTKYKAVSIKPVKRIVSRKKIRQQ